jgi:hypothetical protein
MMLFEDLPPTPSRKELLQALSVQVEHIKSRLDTLESDINNGKYDPVTIITVTNHLRDISRMMDYFRQNHFA